MAGRKGANHDILKVDRKPSYGKMNCLWELETKCLWLVTAKTVRSGLVDSLSSATDP